jgi:hypothetical protein
MITNTGKKILAKYLIGQAPAYASHIAVGCGAQAVVSAGDLETYNQKESLDFEMFRAPIVSRGYIKDGEDTKIVFTAELPTQERYAITEIGLYSAGSNPVISGYDSRVLYSFSRQEAWRYNDARLAEKDIPLDNGNASNDIDDQGVPVFQTNATNKLFSNVDRQKRGDQSRFLNNMVMIRGDFSKITGSNNIDFANVNSKYISLSSTSLNIGQNSPGDKIKIAFSVINTAGTVTVGTAPVPDIALISLVFETSSGQSATFNAKLIGDTEPGGTADFTENRYYVVETTIGNFTKTSGFFWSQVNNLKIYAAVVKDDEVTDDFYIGLDAIRLDNVTSVNPIYGLTGYTVVVNNAGSGAAPYPGPIVKLPNTSSLVEFRLGIDI